MRLATIKRLTAFIIIACMIVSICIISLSIAVATAQNRSPYSNPLIRNEQDFRISTQLSGELSEDIELLAVTVIPHVRSNNVAYEKKDYNSTKEDLGALFNIYIKNKSSESLSPSITFAGKTATQYITAQDHSVSWANTPDTRAYRQFDSERVNKDGTISTELSEFIPLSTELMPEAIDCYSINITDGRLLYDGLEMVITANNKVASATLYADHPYLNIYRLMWTSSSKALGKPDGLLFYIDNKSSQEAIINSVAFYDGTNKYYEHYWSISHKDYVVSLTNNTIQGGDIYYGSINFSDIVPTQEYLVEFNVTHMGKTYSIIHKTKPLVMEYDVAVGWADSDAVSEAYLKAITSMHFNTVIYNINDGYMQLPENIKEKYPIKWFNGDADKLNYGEEYIADNTETEENELTIRISDVHAALPFGEPQLNDTQEQYQPMRCFNKLAMYRNIPVPTNITLTHEPAFYRFTGLSDIIHYDAYRINAPYSDNWLAYYPYLKEYKFGWWYAAPLETTGDYMRTQSALFYPNRIAAWTQGAKTWNIVRRPSRTEQFRYSPNPYELRMQAYLNVANGANSLYWFNIKSGDLLYNQDSSKEMWEVNREFAIIRDYLAYQVPYYHNNQYNYDLNSTIGTDYAILYVNDLNYRLSSAEYKYNGIRDNSAFRIKVPDYLASLDTLVKIDSTGIHVIEHEIIDGYVNFHDSVNMTGLYMLIDSSEITLLQAQYESVIEKEIFNYLDNEDDLNDLRALLNLKEGEEYKPKSVIKENKIFATIYTIIYCIIALSLIIIILKRYFRVKRMIVKSANYYDI